MDSVKTTTAADFVQVEGDPTPSIGCLNATLPGGETVHLHDGAAFLCGQFKVHTETGPEDFVSMMVYGANGFGLMHLTSPAGARAFAAALIQCANDLDGGKATN